MAVWIFRGILTGFIIWYSTYYAPTPMDVDSCGMQNVPSGCEFTGDIYLDGFNDFPH